MTADPPTQNRVRRSIGPGAHVLGSLLAPPAPWILYLLFVVVLGVGATMGRFFGTREVLFGGIIGLAIGVVTGLAFALIVGLFGSSAKVSPP